MAFRGKVNADKKADGWRNLGNKVAPKMISTTVRLLLVEHSYRVCLSNSTTAKLVHH